MSDQGIVSMRWPAEESDKTGKNVTLFLFVLFALSIFFPSQNQELKLPFFCLAMFFSVCFVLASAGRLFLHRQIIFLCLLYAVVGLMWVQLGLAWDTPGAVAVSTVYVIWPLVYLLFINQLNNVAQFQQLCWVFIIAATLAVAADIGFLLQSFGFVPGEFFTLVGSRNGFGLRSGSPSYSSTRVCLFLFIIPLCMAMILHRWRAGRGRSLIVYSWVMLAISIIMVVISQRRSIFVIAGVAPAMALFTDWLMPPGPGHRRPRYIQFVFAGMAGAALVLHMWLAGYFDYIDWQSMFERLQQGFDFSGKVVSIDPDANARADQSRALIQGWLESPFVGAGLGAATEIQRSQEMPWAYELTYIAILFQTGAVGFAIYLSGILWIVYRLVLIMRDRSSPVRLIAYGMLNGMVGFLIGSASDPYLLAFDYLWVLFMPIGLINLELMRKDRELSVAKAG
jgi:hypothetical protein